MYNNQKDQESKVRFKFDKFVKPEVVIVRSNSLIYDPRVRKISKTLHKKYSILVLGWNREGVKKKIVQDFYRNARLFEMKAPFGRRTLILYLPIFWTWVFLNLIRSQPKIVHACDLDLVLPCYVYKLLFRKKLVFDVFDRYAMTYVPPKNKRLYAFITSLEEFFSFRSDLLVNVSEKLQGTFHKKPTKCAIIMNCAEDHLTTRIRPQSSKLQIIHSGGIRRTRGLEELTAAISDIPDVELIIAGRVVHEDLKNEILKVSNVRYLGILSPEDLISLESQCDVCVAFYDPKDPINEYSVGNKLFESMMLGIPIITNVAAEIVTEVNNGFIVNYSDVDQIKKVILSLRDDVVLRHKLGENARKAFLKKYNWSAMEHELYRYYDELLAEEQ